MVSRTKVRLALRVILQAHCLDSESPSLLREEAYACLMRPVHPELQQQALDCVYATFFSKTSKAPRDAVKCAVKVIAAWLQTFPLFCPVGCDILASNLRCKSVPTCLRIAKALYAQSTRQPEWFQRSEELADRAEDLEELLDEISEPSHVDVVRKLLRMSRAALGKRAPAARAREAPPHLLADQVGDGRDHEEVSD